ncbi:MAG: nucleotidyltransferase family protein [Pseudomonadota bacterium]
MNQGPPSSVLLFAAGFGTRMAPLTDTMPKPLIRVDGRALIDHARDLCHGLHQVANVHYRADQLRKHLHGSDVLISDETDLLRDTGGGLKHALPLLQGDPVYTLNTDAVWTKETALSVLRNAWEPDRMEGLLLLVRRENAIGHHGTSGFDRGTDGRLTKGPGFVYTGAQIIRTERLTDISDTTFSMWSLWTGMLQRGTLFGAIYDGQWCDVGYPDAIPLAEAVLRKGADV